MTSAAFVPDDARFGPPDDWVTVRDLDLSYRSPGGCAESVLLIDQQHHAGLHARYTRLSRRLETLATVQQGSQFRCDFDPATQRVVIHSLALLRGETRVEQGTLERLRRLNREENLERLVLDGTVTLVALLDDVRPGDVVDVSYTIYSKPRIFPEHYAGFSVVPVSCHARLFSLSVRFSNAKPMAWKTDSAKITRTEQVHPNGEHEWSWQVERFAPREPEAGMPPWHFQGRYIQFSNFPDWAFVSAGISAAWQEELEHPQVVARIQEIAAMPSVVARIEAVIRWVQDEIRYLSVNTELGGQIPSNPGVVLERRFGDCKDKAFLLAHMLRLLGVPARPVLVHSGWRHRVKDFLPMPLAFDHAIAEFEWDGQRRWVDTTVPLQGGGPFGRAITPFGLGLPIGPGVMQLEPIAVRKVNERSFTIREIFRIEGDGTLALTVVKTLTGSFADDHRFHEALEGTGALNRQQEETYRRMYPKAARIGESRSHDDRGKNEITCFDQFVLPGAMVSTDEPGTSAFQWPAHLIQSVLVLPGNQPRKCPLALPYPCRVEQVIECEFRTLAESRGTALVDILAQQFELRAHCNRAARKTTFGYALSTLADHVNAEEYPRHVDKVEQAWRETVLAIFVPSDYRSAGARPAAEAFLPSAQAAPVAPAPSTVESTPIAVAAALQSPDLSKTVEPASVPARSTGRRQEGVRRSILHAGPRAADYARNASLAGVFIYIIIRVVMGLMASGG